MDREHVVDWLWEPNLDPVRTMRIADILVIDFPDDEVAMNDDVFGRRVEHLCALDDAQLNLLHKLKVNSVYGKTDATITPDGVYGFSAYPSRWSLFRAKVAALLSPAAILLTCMLVFGVVVCVATIIVVQVCRLMGVWI